MSVLDSHFNVVKQHTRLITEFGLQFAEHILLNLVRQKLTRVMYTSAIKYVLHIAEKYTPCRLSHSAYALADVGARIDSLTVYQTKRFNQVSYTCLKPT